MKHSTEYQHWYNFFTKYSIITIALLIISLLSSVLTFDLVFTHPVKAQSPLHLQQHAAPDVGTGTELWHFQISDNSQPYNSTEFETPTVANGIVYYVALDGYLYALKQSNGSLLWKYQVVPNGDAELYTPAVANGVVFVTSSGPDNTPLYAFNANTGSLLW